MPWPVQFNLINKFGLTTCTRPPFLLLTTTLYNPFQLDSPTPPSAAPVGGCPWELSRRAFALWPLLQSFEKPLETCGFCALLSTPPSMNSSKWRNFFLHSFSLNYDLSRAKFQSRIWSDILFLFVYFFSNLWMRWLSIEGTIIK